MSAIIRLHNRSPHLSGWAVVDLEDADELRQYWWRLDNCGYATRTVKVDGKVRAIGMHRQILGLEPGDKRHADHINRNRADNRRSNLRIVTSGENKQNVTPWGKTSRYRGVCWHKQIKRWQARGRLNGVRHQIGTFASEEEAGEAAAAWRAEHHPFSEDALKAAA